MIVPLLIAVHVLGVVLWIGGVAFVTIIVFPMLMRMESSMEKVMFFQGVEHRFAKIAKMSVAVVGLTGGWALSVMHGWNRLFTAQGIDITLMLVVWTFYLLVLLFEGKLFKIIFKGEAQHDMSKVFLKLTAFHWVVLVLSLLTIFVGVFAGHGGF
ncbi:MAG: hypothetical protein HQL08_08210 [Nitrospirae bacterium]|nr:hypothetical protein [Nitrospirota bacterium]